MPFNCDVCGDEVRYSERVFKLRNGAEIVICAKCVIANPPTNPREREKCSVCGGKRGLCLCLEGTPKKVR